jgi:cation diffusion facilitator family transporter
MSGPSTERHSGEHRTNQQLAEKGIRSAVLGIVVNAGLAVIKGVAGYFGNSYALVADAIESSSDVVSSMIVVSGLRIAAKPRDHNHPYGHGKAEPIAAMVVALSLFGAALTIITQSIHEIITPHHAPASFTLAVLVVVVITKESLFRFVFRVAEDVHSTAVRTDAWHHRSDAITSAAAFIGITIALIGGEGFESADDWAALFASAIIIYNAYTLFRPALDEFNNDRSGGPRRDRTGQMLCPQNGFGVFRRPACDRQRPNHRAGRTFDRPQCEGCRMHIQPAYRRCADPYRTGIIPVTIGTDGIVSDTVKQ